jgi:hypothetical protein
MVGTKVLLTQLSGLLGADTTTIAGALKAGLYINEVNPTINSVAADFDPATFDGSTTIAVTAATRPDNYDPATADRIITITPPAGGFLWSTSGTTNLPQTIYGAYIGTAAVPSGTLYGAVQFDPPVTLTDVDQQVAVAQMTFRLLAGCLQ